MTARRQLPDHLTSSTLGEVVAGHLADLAESLEAEAAETGQTRVQAATVRLLRRAGRQIEDYLGENE